MKLICIMPVRNEAWVLGLTARAVLRWCDELIILDHCSTDRTPLIWGELLGEHPGRMAVIAKPDPTWHEMAHRQDLLEKARERGATHIVMVDADEILTGNVAIMSRLNSHLTWEKLYGTVLQLPWIQLRDSIHNMHNSGVWAEQQVSMAFQDSPELHWAAREGYDFHHRHPMGRECIPYRPLRREQGGLMHLQMVNPRRLRAKQLLYCLTERLRWPDRELVADMVARYSLAVYGAPKQAAAGVPHWAPRTALRAGEAPGPVSEFATVPAEWWAPYADLMQYLDVDAEPWQLAECHRVLRENPGIEAGLDDFGLGLFGPPHKDLLR